MAPPLRRLRPCDLPRLDHDPATLGLHRLLGQDDVAGIHGDDRPVPARAQQAVRAMADGGEEVGLARHAAQVGTLGDQVLDHLGEDVLRSAAPTMLRAMPIALARWVR
jgi:hypothetical protein